MVGEIQIAGVQKSFVNPRGGGVTALSGVNLTLASGSFTSLIGPSGCGKSTLLRLLAGLIAPDEGSLSLDGSPIRAPGSDRGRVEEYIELVGLRGFERYYPHQLSGGMCQRASLARALVGRPKVLLLDEPLGALDAFTRMNMQEELLRVWKEQHTTMVMVTHDVDEAVYLSDQIVVMTPRPGKIIKIVDVQLGRPRARSSHDFLQYHGEVLRLLDYGGVEQAPDYYL